MNSSEVQLGGNSESEPRLTESEIIDLKKELLEGFLLDDVAAAYALENYPFTEDQTPEQRYIRAIDRAAQIGVILAQNVMRPNAEWEEGVPQPEDFLPHARLQGALRRSTLIPNEIAQLAPNSYPGEWGEWERGLRPNPHLTETDIKLLHANGYSVLIERSAI